MEAVLARLLLPDSQEIAAATADLRAAFKQPGVIPELCAVLTSSPQLQVRQYAAVLLRKKFHKARSWRKFSAAERAQLKSGVLASLVAEQEQGVRAALVQLVGSLARHELEAGGGGWPELMELIQQRVVSQAGAERVQGVTLVSVLAEVAGEQVRGSLKDFLGLFRKTLQDTEMEVCFLTIVAMTHFVQRCGSDEVNLFQQLVPLVLVKVEQIAALDQDKAVVAIDIFDELIEAEVAIVVPHIKPMVELCLRLAQDKEDKVEDALKIKAVTFLGRLTRLKKKTIVKHKLYLPMIQVMFEVMTKQEVDEDDPEEEDEDDDSPALAASQSLDMLALNLPPEKYISALLAQVQPALESPSQQVQRAAYQAVAVSAEGCQEHIRTKYLPSMLAIMSRGIAHPAPCVRNAALYMLGQFSEFIQPEISNHAPDILPVLLAHMDEAFRHLKPGDKESSTLSRIFYALETFCENLEDKLVPHLELIMSRANTVLQGSFSVRVQELAISLVGAAANATKGAIVPYLGTVWPCLERYLAMQHTDDTEVLLTQAMSTLGVLARAVGQQHFSREFAEKCLNIGMELVQKNDNPDVRKCAYSLFGSVASVVKEEMAAVMAPIVDLMLKSIQSTEGISLETEENNTGLPLEQLSEDEEEDLEDKDSQDTAVSDMEDIKSMSVQNEYVAEKECAVSALKDLAMECGAAFHPFLPAATEEVSTLLDYPDYDVRAAAIDATAHFLIAYYRSGSAEGRQLFEQGVGPLVARLAEAVVTEEEHQIVIAALDALTELLKQCKDGVTGVQGHPELIVSCVQKIMKGECACQDAEEAEGGEEEDEEAEQDEMLFEYAGEVLPTLGRALAPATFAPYFTGLLPMLLKKTKKHCSVAERSFAVGAIADSLEPLQGVLDPFLQHLLPLFVEMLKDEEDDVRNNSIYGLGELVLWGGEAAVPHYSHILATLSRLAATEASPRVVDQVTGALCRFVVTGHAAVPVAEVVPAVLARLPLQEDLEEYDLVFKALLALYSASHPLTASTLPAAVASAAHFTLARGIDDKAKTAPLVAQLLKSLASSFPGQVEAAAAALPAEQQAAVAEVMAS